MKLDATDYRRIGLLLVVGSVAMRALVVMTGAPIILLPGIVVLGFGLRWIVASRGDREAQDAVRRDNAARDVPAAHDIPALVERLQALRSSGAITALEYEDARARLRAAAGAGEE